MKTEYEKCMAGEPFIGSEDPKITEMILRTRRLLVQFNATDYADNERRQELLREMLGSIGKGVHVDIDFHCECGKHIFIGDKVIINMNCTFVDNNRIDIGNNVLIAVKVKTPDGKEEYKPIFKGELEETGDKLKIKEYVEVKRKISNDTPQHRKTYKAKMKKWHKHFKDK